MPHGNGTDAALVNSAEVDSGLRGHSVAPVTPEDPRRGFSSRLRERTEITHRLAAAVADPNLDLIRLAHAESLHNASAFSARKPTFSRGY
jgi:hypothetical protein